MISIKTPEEIGIMRKGGKILALISEEISRIVRPGVSAFTLNKLAEELIKKYGVLSAFKGYIPDRGGKNRKVGYPAVLCVSLNSEVVHGLPTKEKIIKEGDVVSLDIGIKYQDFFLDRAITLGIGKISPQAKKLIEVTRNSLDLVIKKIRPGIYLGDLSATIQNFVEQNGFSVVRDLTGHGIGKKLHEEPAIFNFGQIGSGPILKEGMVLAFEPMVNISTYQVRTLSDGWTVVTSDGGLSAHFEETVAVLKDRAEILTQ